MSHLTTSFRELGLQPALLRALDDLGYETPSPIQQQSISLLLNGHDLIAQAQTGTGKTAAFGLPILQNLDLVAKHTSPQALILTPTRELAIQVAEALQGYAKYLKPFQIVPIYGGQDYQQQLRALKRGVQLIVGTPGRVMDHIRRGTLQFDTIRSVVLDEADEMLKMGFLEDVEWILEQIPHDHQAALFSATMPSSIKKIATTYLTQPKQVKVKAQSIAAPSIKQSAMLVSPQHKIEALTRYLEVQQLDAVIIFTRTKTMAADLAEKLSARGYFAAPLHGDMNQSSREKVIQRVKQKKLDIIVATDVAARGLDVDRLGHVINFDAPYDAETYTHRIGRTGRAGRVGKSLLLLTPREKHFLRDIELGTKSPVELIDLPSAKQLSDKRIENFMTYVGNVLKKGKLDYYRNLVETIAHSNESSELDVAAALLKMAQKDKPLKVQEDTSVLVDESRKTKVKHKVRRKPNSKRVQQKVGRRAKKSANPKDSISKKRKRRQ